MSLAADDKPGDLLKAAQEKVKAKDLAGAAEIYAGISADPAAGKSVKTQAIKGLASILMGRGQFDEARGEYQKLLALPDLKPAEQADAFILIGQTHDRQQRFAVARSEYAKAVGLPGLDEKKKLVALIASARTYHREGDLVNLKKAVADLGQPGDFSLCRDYALLAAEKMQPAEEEAAWTQILEMPNLTNPQRAEATFKKIDLLATGQRIAEIKPLAEAAATNEQLNAEQRFLAAVLVAGLASPPGSPGNLAPMPATNLNPDQQAKLYADAAKIFMRARNYAVAKALGQQADSLFRAIPQYVYDCHFMDQSPFGVSGWQNSDIVKDPSRRESRFEEYNKKAAALLINDVNLMRDTGAGDAKPANIHFFMAADPRGWHIYVQCQDDQVEQVLAGLTRGGTLEMYFAPGQGECYYQWMLPLPAGQIQFIPWTSPHRRYRKLDDYLKTEIAPVPGGFGVYLMIPWELIYDKLPHANERWTFGLVNWSRHGGFTWGSGQVHELNKFGRVQFTGIEKYRPAIERALVMKAYAKYKTTAATAATFWNDEVKGDQVFFAKILKPKIDQLNEPGKLVKPELTAADATRLFATVVPDWMEFEYLVGELRRAYLTEQLLQQP
ncbi:MAG: hypothetical protein PCFJNLEI_02069 [Verrucomicrobiae bacterium]|nr:hypothetical protein [Verrucomicrobiae bacterium]